MHTLSCLKRNGRPRSLVEAAVVAVVVVVIVIVGVVAVEVLLV